MKKLSISLTALVATLLVSCTLYMDEEDIESALRTEPGYLEEETITLPEGQGTVTYKYNKNTIAITDEVEEYVIRNEEDEVVWFSAATPDHLLPETGEMMTCSFRDKFPNGFCHRCTGQSKVDGLYRCTFEPCGLFEAFDEFKADVAIDQYAITPAEGVRVMNEEEVAAFVDEESESEPAEGGDEVSDDAESRAPMTRAPSNYNLSFKMVDMDIYTNLIDVASAKGAVEAMATLTGSVKIGHKGYLYIDRSQDYTQISFSPYGNFSLTFNLKAYAGVTLEAPVPIPILGLGANLGVVGFKIGLTATPYVTIRRYIQGKMGFNLYYNCNMLYTKQGEKKGVFKVGGSTRKSSGKPVFTWDGGAKDLSGTEANFYFEAGIDYSLGFGADLFGLGGQASVGAKYYWSLEQTLNKEDFTSVADFRERNANFPVYVKFYAKTVRKNKLGEVGPNEEVVFKAGNLNIPFYPSWEKGKACCTYLNPVTYTFEGHLKELGLVGALFDYLPKAYVYDDETNKLVKTYDLKYKSGSLLDFSADVKDNTLKFNHLYTTQFVMQTGDGVHLPLADYQLYTCVPDINITDLSVVQTLTPNNASYEEQSNPSVVGINPKTMQKCWIYNGSYYKYRYKVNVALKLDALENIKKWGIHMNDNWAHSADFESTSKKYEKPVVRMTWYTNNSSVNLQFTPYAQLINEKGEAMKDKKWYSVKSVMVEYNPYLDKPFGYQSWELDGGNANFEK